MKPRPCYNESDYLNDNRNERVESNTLVNIQISDHQNLLNLQARTRERKEIFARM